MPDIKNNGDAVPQEQTGRTVKVGYLFRKGKGLGISAGGETFYTAISRVQKLLSSKKMKFDIADKPNSDEDGVFINKYTKDGVPRVNINFGGYTAFPCRRVAELIAGERNGIDLLATVPDEKIRYENTDMYLNLRGGFFVIEDESGLVHGTRQESLESLAFGDRPESVVFWELKGGEGEPNYTLVANRAGKSIGIEIAGQSYFVPCSVVKEMSLGERTMERDGKVVPKGVSLQRRVISRAG